MNAVGDPLAKTGDYGKYVIGLTGNVATGKTLVLRMLKEIGAYIIDADDLAHVLMRQGGPLYARIVTEFGRYILDEDAEIDHGKLGEIVFAVPRALARLEAVTHPTINAVARQLIASAKANVVVIEAVKLIESGFAKECDAVWVVTAAQHIQLQRLIIRRRMTGPQAILRIEAQAPQEAKIAEADVVIDNSGDVLETWRTVQRHYAAIPRPAMPAPEMVSVVAAREPARAVEAPPSDLLKKIDVRRARRTDLEAMAAAIAQATRGEQAPGERVMMEKYFSRGYFLAWAGEYLLGMVGLHTENLIATIDDYVVRPAKLWPTVGKALLDAVEADAQQLSCEVAFVFVPADMDDLALVLFEKNGYQKQRPADLVIKMWREAAEDYAGDGSVLLVKPLLEHQIMRPI
jgi:dephospho-CoA kinase